MSTRGILNLDRAVMAPGCFGFLTIADIAVRLGRELRFGGGVRVWWTVLQHSLTVETMVMDMLADRRRDYRNSVRIFTLLHDAHEAVLFGDTPTPLKTDEMRAAEREMDKRIYAMLGLPDIPPQYVPIIKKADTRALLAEGAIVGPPGFYRHYAAENPGVVAEFKRYERGDREIVASLAATYPDCRHTFRSDSPAVIEYLRTLEQAIAGSGLLDEEDMAA